MLDPFLEALLGVPGLVPELLEGTAQVAVLGSVREGHQLDVLVQSGDGEVGRPD